MMSDQQNAEGETAIDLSVQYNLTDIVKFLQEQARIRWFGRSYYISNILIIILRVAS